MNDKVLTFISEAIMDIDPELNLNVENNYHYAIGAIRLAKSIEVIPLELASFLEEAAAIRKKGLIHGKD